MNREEFVTYTDNWGSHQPLLWLALEATKHLKLPVLEMGCGETSTPILRRYCADNGLNLISFDSNKEWADKYGANYTKDWHVGSHIIPWFTQMRYSVVLCDEAPGGHRKVTLNLFRSYPVHAQIIVAHDTEPAADHGYQMRPILKTFKYMKDYETDGAWATAVSNFIDVTKWEV